MSIQDPTAVVCGAGGFIGGHLIKGLLERGVRVIRGVDRKPLHEWYQVTDGIENLSLDLMEKEHCMAAVDEADYVYQLAADMGGMGFIESNKALCMLNVMTSTNMLTAARQANIKKYFYASSACVYNADKQTRSDLPPLREADAYPAQPEDGYGWEKLFSERMCRHFEEDFGMICRVARYHNVYGPHGAWTGGREKAPAAICRKVIQAKLAGTKEIVIWGDGQQSRSFMYVGDCVHGTHMIMKSDIDEPVNLGSSELVTINGLVDIVEDIAGIRLDRIYDRGAPKGVTGRNSDNSLILSRLDWEPSVRLRDGLEKTYQWIERQMVEGRSD